MNLSTGCESGYAFGKNRASIKFFLKPKIEMEHMRKAVLHFLKQDCVCFKKVFAMGIILKEKLANELLCGIILSAVF